METFLVLGVLYLVVMTIGALSYRVPPENWAPEGWVVAGQEEPVHLVRATCTSNDAHKTLSFWMIWGVLFLNVTAGIAVLSIASPMLQNDLRTHLDRPAGRRHPRRQAGRRHRGDRRRLRRPAVAVQHRRALLLGLAGRTRSAARRPTSPSSSSA